MGSSSIQHVRARQILDSRGRPTVEVDVRLKDGSIGRACVPSGASAGRHEVLELRDGDPGSHEGASVRKAVANVNERIAGFVAGRDALDQRGLDRALIELDGSPRLSVLGGNAVLATSLATCRAAAGHRALPLHLYIAEICGASQTTLPMPMTNILSGGAHAGRSMDLQDFLVVPVGAASYSEALDMIMRVRSSAAELMAEQGLSVLIADEGGLSPGFGQVEEALDLMMRSFERAGLAAGDDVAVAIDVAASELYSGGAYQLPRAGMTLSGEKMIDLLVTLVDRYPIVSIEDALDQDDWSAWREATRRLSSIQVVGDDLFATNPMRIARGVEQQVANAVLIKVNQNGTLMGTFDAIDAGRAAGYATIVSARSGETEDNFIADLAVGTGAGQIKIGSLRNSERLSKYNQLLRIEADYPIAFAGRAALSGNGVARHVPRAAALE